MTFVAWIIFLTASILEVGGDAVIRKGLRNQGIVLIIIGFMSLGCYGLLVNMVKWDFSKLLGVYIAFFALTSVCAGLWVFKEHIPVSNWIGICLIVIGGLTIQFGSH